jgi:integral membrane protein (TIGR01906 family)
MKIKKEQVITITFCIFFTILIMLFSYKVSLGTTTLTENQQSTISFLDNKAELNLNYTVNEASHLEDVKGVMKVVDYCFYLSLVVVTFMITANKRKKEIIKKLFLYGGVSSLIFSGLTLLFTLLSFNFAFTAFHKIFFPQGNWLFPIDSLLIQTFPINFFITISARIMITAVMIAGGTIFIARRMKNDN